MHPSYSLIGPAVPSGSLLPLKPRVRHEGANRRQIAGSKRRRYSGLVHAEAARSDVAGSGNGAARASRTAALKRQLAQLESAIAELEAELTSFSEDRATEEEHSRWGDKVPAHGVLTSAWSRGKRFAESAKEERSKLSERVGAQRRRVGGRVRHEFGRLPPDTRTFLETSSQRVGEWKASVGAAVPPALQPLFQNRLGIAAGVVMAVLLTAAKWFSEMRKDSRCPRRTQRAVP